MNKHEIIRSLELAALAYKDSQPLSQETELAFIESDSGAKYFIRRKRDFVTITFRGSDSPQNWKSDLTFWKKKIPYDNPATDIRVHTGFIDAYKDRGVREVIQSFITHDVRRVRISGHSYGAAMAVLCAVDLEYNFPHTDIEVCIFGCPRIGNAAFKKSYNKRVVKTVRVENGNDIVTKLPFALWGFRHVGAKMHIGPPRAAGRFSFVQHYPYSYYSNLLKRLL